MTSPLTRLRLFAWASTVLLTALPLFLVGCSDGDRTPPAPEASPSVAETVAKNDPAIPSPYPLDTCVVSGEKLDSMGGAYDVEVDGQTVKLCCAGCEDQFRADPAKYLAMLDAPTTSGKLNQDGHGHDEHDHQ